MRTHLDLCSGIGGFSIAAAWNGYTTIGFCEIDPYCQKVLRKHWPETPLHDDLKTLTAGTVRGWTEGISVLANTEGSGSGRQGEGDEDARVGSAGGGEGQRREGRERRLALLTAGYPCQPFSQAGKRLGEADDRHLWPAIAALVADLQPAQCLFENVAGHITLGLDRVLADLEALGYACWPVVVPACAVDAPHRRDRVWILAHACGETEPEQGHEAETIRHQRNARLELGRGSARLNLGQPEPTVADTEGFDGRRQPFGDASPHAITGRDREVVPDAANRGLRCRGPQGNQGLAALGNQSSRTWWATEPHVGRVAHGVPKRVDRLRSLGNAIVPQVAAELIAAMSTIL